MIIYSLTTSVSDMSVGGAGRTTGIAALLVVSAVVLAASGLPVLGGHTPIDAVSPSAGEQVEEAVSGDPSAPPQDVDGQPDPGDVDIDPSDPQLDESVAEAADDAELGEVTRALAGALALAFDDEIGGELGDSTADFDEDAVDADAFGDDGADAFDDDADSDEADGSNGGLADDVDADAFDADGEDGVDPDALPDDVDPEDLPAGVDPAEIDGDAFEDGDVDPDAFPDDVDPSEFDDDERALLESLVSDDEDDASDDDEGVAAGIEDRAPEVEGLVDSDLRTAGIALGALLALLVAVLGYRSEKPFVAFLLGLPTQIAARLLRIVFTVGSLIERAIGRLREVTSVAELRAVIAAAFREARNSARESVHSLFGEETTTESVDPEGVVSEREQIRSAWRTVVDLVSIPRYSRRTPAAIKQQAVDNGLPEPPVTTLLGAFRAVEYGERDPTTHAESAVDAANQVESAAAKLAESDDDAAEENTEADVAAETEADNAADDPEPNDSPGDSQ